MLLASYERVFHNFASINELVEVQKVNSKKNISIRKPKWLATKVPVGKEYLKIRDIVNQHKLHTICTSGNCPNMAECWGRGTATFMILGDICTRSCKFCNVKTGKPFLPDADEPKRVAESVQKMKVKHVVLTSVDRDDLEDKGAGIWAKTIMEIKKLNPMVTIEALIPDFDGDHYLINQVIQAGPEVISHNIETVKRLTKLVRSRASYELSLKVIQHLSLSNIRSKSGIMVGLGERDEEVRQTMRDLYAVGCEVFTIGQYLQPTAKHLAVVRFVEPSLFEGYRDYGLQLGFIHVESGPLVRSSYHAEKHIK
jgi:lipoic acid synthetase